jgi:RHS repeat-associated protein
VTAYTYSPSGALASVTTPSVSVSYTSDARNLRQSRTVGAVTQQFTWSSVGGLPLLLSDGEHSYIYGVSSTPIAQVDEATGAVQYLHSDLLGTPRLVTDAGGSQVGTSTVDAFGSLTTHSGVQSAFGFTGNWTDPDTGLLYLRARDYDPETGQFLTVDPLVDQTRQPYAYAGNNPVTRTDPSGLNWEDDLNTAAEGLFVAAIAGFLFPNAWGILRSDDPEAQVIGGWALGLSGPTTTYGEGTELVEHLKAMPETTAHREELIYQLHHGTYQGPLQAGYRAGSPGLGNPNFVDDALTYITWGARNPEERIRAALGTYDLYVSVVCVDDFNGTALIAYSGGNRSSLGSAFGTGEFRNFLNDFAEITGFGNAVDQEFYWQEVVQF